MATVTTESAGFEIVHRNRLLMDTKREGTKWQKPDGVLIRGDVARLADGRFFARWSHPGPAGPVTWYAPWSALTDPTTAACTPPVDYRQRIKETLGRWGEFNILAQSVDPTDLERFRKDYPTVATMLGLELSPTPWRRFQPGPVRWQRGRFSDADIRVLIDAHSAGDWGVLGEYNEVQLSLEDEWTLHERPVDVQSSVAVDRNSGVVLSRWVLPIDEQSRCARPAWLPDRKFHLDIITVLGRGGPETIVTLGYVD